MKKRNWMPEKRTFVLQASAGSAAGILSVLSLVCFAAMTDYAVAKETGLFLKSAAAILILLPFQFLFRYLQNSARARCRAVSGDRLRKKLYGSIVHAVTRNGIRKSEVLNFVNTQAEQLQEYAERIAEVPSALITLTAASAYLVCISGKLFLAVVLFIPLSSYILQKLNRRLQEKNREILRAKETLNFDMKQVLEGFYLIRAYRLREQFFSIFREDAEKLREKEGENDRIGVTLGRIFVLLVFLPQMILLLYGGWLCVEGELTAGELIAANTVVDFIILPAQTLLEILQKKRLVQPVEETYARLLEIPGEREKESAASGQQAADDRPMIEIRNLSFAYPGKRVFEQLDLSVPGGCHLALTGESGCGKSTLVKLILGFEKPGAGKILVNGISADDVKRVREQIAFVPQEPYLIDGTLKENICMGKEVGRRKLEEAVNAALLQDVVRTLPEGMETMLGADGMRLSGGQMKRVGIARALVSDAPICILDEPLSALDARTSWKIQENLSLAWKDRTVLIITHQLLPGWKKDCVIRRMEGGNKANEAACAR